MINVLKDLVIIIVVLKIVFEDNHSIFEFLGVITSVWFDSWMHERGPFSNRTTKPKQIIFNTTKWIRFPHFEIGKSNQNQVTKNNNKTSIIQCTHSANRRLLNVTPALRYWSLLRLSSLFASLCTRYIILIFAFYKTILLFLHSLISQSLCSVSYHICHSFNERYINKCSIRCNVHNFPVKCFGAKLGSFACSFSYSPTCILPHCFDSRPQNKCSYPTVFCLLIALPTSSELCSLFISHSWSSLVVLMIHSRILAYTDISSTSLFIFDCSIGYRIAAPNNFSEH